MNNSKCKREQDETWNYCKEITNKISEYVSALGIKTANSTLHKIKSMIKEIWRTLPERRAQRQIDEKTREKIRQIKKKGMKLH